MPTSVHIPKPLLDALDRRARALRVSRNRLIVRAIERELKQASEWSPELLALLNRPVDAETAAMVTETFAAVRANRRSKKPLEL